MSAKKNISVADILPLIEEHNGNVAAIARHFGVGRATIWRRIEKSPVLQQSLQDARETMLDNAESALYKAVLEGEAWAVCFFLKTQGKNRGYTERQEHDVQGSLHIELKWGDGDTDDHASETA
ncbi:MAG: hypothetical protein D6706_15885 [Chloroflexi bacterium]|nr:MAG: hypothetical protein D6706_15885 [Chloroflexota bacterium]